MVRRCTSQLRSSIWRMAMFFSIVGIPSLAVYLTFYAINKKVARKTTEHCQFLRK